MIGARWKNSGNIGDKYWKLAAAFDPENAYTVPYFWGTLGILYDTTRVSEPVDSWDVLFNGDLILLNERLLEQAVLLVILAYAALNHFARICSGLGFAAVLFSSIACAIRISRSLFSTSSATSDLSI